MPGRGGWYIGMKSLIIDPWALVWTSPTMILPPSQISQRKLGS
jgi:hypothetical protein